MVKTIRFTLLLILAFSISIVSAHKTVIIDFDNDYQTIFPTLGGVSSNESNAGDISETIMATVGDVKIVISPDANYATSNRIWFASPRLRMYSGTFSIMSMSGNISKIEFTSDRINMIPNRGVIGNNIWIGSGFDQTVIFSISSNTRISSIVVTINDESTNDSYDPDNPNNPIFYNLISKVKVATVTRVPSEYSGHIVIPESVEYNGDNYSVTGIGEHSFNGCSGLLSITIPNSVTSIGKGAFYGCSGLTSITIPNSVTSIGEAAFSGCTGLTSIAIPNSVTCIGEAAFSGCSSLTSVTIPNSVTSIGHYAFKDCSGLTSIAIPNSVTCIEEAAFSRCSSLTSVTIPNFVTSIGQYAFKDCSGLTSIAIPNYVTSIGEATFSGCSSLISVTIPNSVTSIGWDAFSGCPELTDVYCYAEAVPSTSADAFDDSYIEYATLHVPESAIENYKTTAPWSSFKNIVSVTDNNNYFDLSITVTNAFGKVTYGTTEITDGQQTFDVKDGSDVVLTLTPNDGYRIATLTVNGEDKTVEVVDDQLTISNVTANVVVNVSFITAGETASVSIGSTGMATLCSAKDLDFTEVSGLKAYTGAGFNRTTGALTMLEVKDAPAGTGLVLIGGEGTYDIPVKPSASVYGNLLVGVTEDTQLAQTANGYTNYILGNGDHGLGFYIVTAEGGTLAAGKAYLRLPIVTANARRVISIEYGEGVTAVDGQRMTPVESDGSYYTLNGQRMTGTPSKAGVYIKDGHKVIIK